MYYMLLTLWLSQPGIQKEMKEKQTGLELQDNANQAELTAGEKLSSSVSAGKDNGSCR